MISVIIPTIHSNEEYLQATIAAVRDTAPDAQIIVPDDDVSFAQNCNRGALMADGSTLVFLNDDTIPVPGWLDALTAPLADDIGITGARLLYPDNTLQHAGIYLDTPDNILTAHNITEDAPTRDVDAVTGACLAISRILFADCTGFDPGFDNGYEDVDLCLRVRAGGWRVHYVREAVVYHYESSSGPARWRSVGANVQRLQDLWSFKEVTIPVGDETYTRQRLQPNASSGYLGDLPSHDVRVVADG